MIADSPTKIELIELLPYLTAQERADLDHLLTADDAIDWQPRQENKPQQMAFESPADVIGYGGQAGGGKTDLALGLSLKKHKKSIIFRREATQLRDIVERSREIIGARGTFNESLLIWRQLPGGRRLELGGIKNDGDVSKWRGRPHDLIAFDEATEFTERQIRFLTGWNRSTDPEQKCQVLLCFNPPSTPEGRWVLTFFGPWLDPKHPRPAKPGEIRWYARVDNKEVERPDGEPFEHKGETITPKSRTFIPASLKDNPDLAHTGYEANLQSLPEPLRSQLLYGDFQAGIKDDDYQVIPTAWVKAAMARWRLEGRPKDEKNKPVPLSALGVDVARGGDDESVLAPRYGNWFDTLLKYRGAETASGPRLVAKIITLLEGRGEARATGKTIEFRDEALTLDVVECATPIQVDVIGVGTSVYDTARMVQLQAQGINAAEHTQAMDKSGRLNFVNVRAEMYWTFREMLDPANDQNIALPDDSALLGDLTAPRWKLQANGILIEPKEDIKNRLGRSPDSGDAVVLAAFARPLQIFI